MSRVSRKEDEFFDMFKNYEERGQLFARAVGALA